MKKTLKKLKIISFLVLITALNQPHTRAAMVKKGATQQKPAADRTFLQTALKTAMKDRFQRLHEEELAKLPPRIKIAAALTNPRQKTPILQEEKDAAKEIDQEITSFFSFLEPQLLKLKSNLQIGATTQKGTGQLIQNLKLYVNKTPLPLDALKLAHQLQITPKHIYNSTPKEEYGQLMGRLLTGEEKQITFKDGNNQKQTTTPLTAIYNKYNNQRKGGGNTGANSPWEQLIQKVISTNYSEKTKSEETIRQLEKYIEQINTAQQNQPTDVSDFQRDIEYLDDVIIILDQFLCLQNQGLSDERDIIYREDTESNSNSDSWSSDNTAKADTHQDKPQVDEIAPEMKLIEQQREYIKRIHEQLIKVIPAGGIKNKETSEQSKRQQQNKQALEVLMNRGGTGKENGTQNQQQGPAVKKQGNKQTAPPGDKQNKKKGAPKQQIDLEQIKLLVKLLLEADDVANISSEQITDAKLQAIINDQKRKESIKNYLTYQQQFLQNERLIPKVPPIDDAITSQLNEALKQLMKQHKINRAPTQPIDLEQIKLLVKRLLEADDVTNISSDQITDGTLKEILNDPRRKESIKNYLTAQQQDLQTKTSIPTPPPLDRIIWPQLNKALEELMKQDPNLGATNKQAVKNGSEEGNKTKETGKKGQEIQTSNTQPTKTETQALEVAKNGQFSINATEEGTLANKLQIQILELKAEIYKWIAMTKQLHIEKSKRLVELNKQIEQLTKKLQKNSGKKMINSNKSAKTSK